jgi:NAD(P)-dependent dehydrogenase (short-subunit alcohol dehydrogenase family)
MSTRADATFDFAGKVAVVTAAASGIGRATALRLARDGADVIMIDLNPAVATVAAEVPSGAGSTEAIVSDCTDEDAVKEAFAGIYERHGDIDILVNAVGQPNRGDDMIEFWESDSDRWRFVLNVCLWSTMLCSRQVVPTMRSHGYGKIVNVSSVSWLVPPPPSFTEYAAAKAGVVGFTRGIAAELGKFGVNVNAVSPGPVRSTQTDRQPQEFKQRVLSTVPLGRYGEAEEIAAGIVFLASDEASFITGHNLVIGGGRAMT